MVTIIKLPAWQIEDQYEDAMSELEEAEADPDPDPDLIGELKDRVRVLSDDFELATRPDINELVGNLAGQVDLYKTSGRLIMRTWPERINPGSSYEFAWSTAMFSFVSRMYAALGEEDLVSWHNIVMGGQWTNREKFFSDNLNLAHASSVVPNLIRFTSIYSYPDYLSFSFYTMKDCRLEMNYSQPFIPEDVRCHEWLPKTEETGGITISRNTQYKQWFNVLKEETSPNKLHMFEFFWEELTPELPLIFRLTSIDENGKVDGMTGIYCVAYWVLEAGSKYLKANPYAPYLPIKYAEYPDVILKPNPIFPPVPGNLP